jgi:hypothetical protein
MIFTQVTFSWKRTAEENRTIKFVMLMQGYATDKGK